jgi:hypothetical protein
MEIRLLVLELVGRSGVALRKEASESSAPTRWVWISSDDCSSATAGATSGSGSAGASGCGGLGVRQGRRSPLEVHVRGAVAHGKHSSERVQ